MFPSYLQTPGVSRPTSVLSLVLPSTSEPLRETGTVETHGPLGTLWTGLGLGAFYTALIWVNLLLGHMLTPLFILPLTWIQDAMIKRRSRT